MNEMKDFIERFCKLLPLGKSISQPEAEKRASEFLSAMATITDWRHAFSEEKIRRTSVQSAVYADELSKSGVDAITKAKVIVEASEGYMAAREDLEHIENDLAYLKTYHEIFLNAHLFYRNIAKGEQF